MATFIRLQNSTRSLVEESYTRQRSAEINREREYEAAVQIQSWFRALRVRHYIRHLNKCAIEIQRCWRGYMGRAYFRIRVKNLVMIMRMNLYNAMAVRIQKRWRGFYIRKHVHNYYARKRYLEGLAIKNHIVRSDLKEFHEQQMQEARTRNQMLMEERLQREARKNHYLLSTHQISGIYNSPFRSRPHEMEYRLRVAKPLSHKKAAPAPGAFTSNVVDSESVPVKPRPPDSLPPLTDKNIQGPFKPAKDVRAQRYKALNPSLRVATDFNSLDVAREEMKKEEWTGRLHDIPFVPFTKRKVQYQALLHTTSKYGHLPYGSQFFREENTQQHLVEGRLQTVVSPIPIFDQFGQTYSKGSVLLQ